MTGNLLVALVLTWPGPAISAAPAPQQAKPPDEAEMRAVAAGREQVQALLNQYRFPEANTAARALAKEYPRNADAWLLIAYVHLQDGWFGAKAGRALDAATRARDLGGPRTDILIAQALSGFRQRWEGTMEVLDLLLDHPEHRLQPGLAATLLHERAVLNLHAETDVEAARTKALADLEQALTLAPNHPGVRLERASQRRLAGDYAGAVEDLLVSLAGDPGSVAVHYELKTCYVALKDMEKARHHLKVWQLLLRLTDSPSSASAPPPEERVEILRELRVLNPTDLQRRVDLVAQELEHGDLDRAAQELAELKKEYPRIPALTGLERRIQEAIAKRDGGDD